MIVADTNLISYVVIAGAQSQKAHAAFRRDPDWLSPPFWRSEFLNVLLLSIRGGLLTEPEAQLAWRKGVQLVRAEQAPNPMAVLDTALKQGISAYDAQFVALATELGTRLISADRRLVQRCPGKAVLLDDFAAGLG